MLPHLGLDLVLLGEIGATPLGVVVGIELRVGVREVAVAFLGGADVVERVLRSDEVEAHLVLAQVLPEAVAPRPVTAAAVADRIADDHDVDHVGGAGGVCEGHAVLPCRHLRGHPGPAPCRAVASQDASGRPADEAVAGELAPHDRARGHRDVPPEAGPGKHDGAGADPAAVTDHHRAVQGRLDADGQVGVGVAVVLVGDVRVRGDEDVVADRDGLMGDDVAAPSDQAARADPEDGVGAQVQAGQQTGAEADMAPDQGVVTDLHPRLPVEGGHREADGHTASQAPEAAATRILGGEPPGPLGPGPHVTDQGSPEPAHPKAETALHEAGGWLLHVRHPTKDTPGGLPGGAARVTRDPRPRLSAGPGAGRCRRHRRVRAAFDVCPTPGADPREGRAGADPGGTRDPALVRGAGRRGRCRPAVPRAGPPRRDAAGASRPGRRPPQRIS